VPTIIYMLLLWGAYATLVHRPLMRVLKERHDKTEGAIEKARADVAAAAARTADYEQSFERQGLRCLRRKKPAANVRHKCAPMPWRRQGKNPTRKSNRPVRQSRAISSPRRRVCRQRADGLQRKSFVAC